MARSSSFYYPDTRITTVLVHLADVGLLLVVSFRDGFSITTQMPDDSHVAQALIRFHLGD